eukprot:UN20780
MGILSISLQDQWIKKNYQNFFTFNQLFVFKKYIFLARKIVRYYSDAFKSMPGLFTHKNFPLTTIVPKEVSKNGGFLRFFANIFYWCVVWSRFFY